MLMIGGDVRIDHRGFDTSVAQQRLNRSYVGASGQEMAGKAVPKRMRSHVFHNPGFTNRPFERAPQRARGGMPARHLPRVLPRTHLR